jgi:hypothetical protein
VTIAVLFKCSMKRLECAIVIPAEARNPDPSPPGFRISLAIASESGMTSEVPHLFVT